MIAIAGPNLPHEVLKAANCHAGPVRFDPERKVDRAGQWLESKFYPWAPAVLECWAEGAYDQLDGVLFSRADDTSQRLYYYICELQRLGLVGGPQPQILDIAKIPRDSSLQHTATKVRQLASDLGVSDDALEAAICETNAQRAVRSTQAAGKICLMAGSPPPDDRLHRAVSEAGFVPVGPTLTEEWMDLGEPIAEGSGDPAAAIARQIHTSANGSRSFADPKKLLESRMTASSAQAVVIWRIEEDEAFSWHLPAQKRLLEERGMAHLVLTRRDWLVRDGADGEISNFLKGLDA